MWGHCQAARLGWPLRPGRLRSRRMPTVTNRNDVVSVSGSSGLVNAGHAGSGCRGWIGLKGSWT
jgi:hypothetical protein